MNLALKNSDWERNNVSYFLNSNFKGEWTIKLDSNCNS